VNALGLFHPAVRRWFEASFPAPTRVQSRGWPALIEGRSALLLAPTGSGKTLAAFLAAIDRLMFSEEPAKNSRLRVLYVSPLKALAVDVERNLRAPLAGISASAAREGEIFRAPAIGVRSGDTPASERARTLRSPPDILITTPESLYLMLTSAARETLLSVETVIVDEIHSMVPTKRGAHLFLSLERLEELRRREGSDKKPLQRIGLSATQRPLEEIARLLGGGEISRTGAWSPRPVEIIDAGEKKLLDVRVEVPVEDMSRLGEVVDELSSGPAAAAPRRRSIWPSIHPRLVELIREHRSTIIFVNSRRLAERLAGAINETAHEELALAHHGSLARDARLDIEDRLKSGLLRAIVATSSLELGIDMGAVDLVIQIEAPPSIAAGMQRIGRAGHSVGAASRGIIFPKYRGDLLASAAATARMLEGKVEETHYPRNPLDVLAQQVTAIAAVEPIEVEALYELVRRTATYAELPRSSFEGVLDMLSGRYPSDEFAELRPRLTWDRVAGTIRGREGAKRTAIINAGTIPDRGLYGVFLAGGDEKRSRRVGELDEEMVFESRTGDVFVLGASSWRIEEITHDRVLVSPAPGQPGKMPFWHGDRPGRPLEFGRAIGELARKLTTQKRGSALEKLKTEHGLDAQAAENLLVYLDEQVAATGDVPSDRTIVIERYLDEVGDWRVCVLTPFGARVHAPWATAVRAIIMESTAKAEIDVLWSDDGMVFRLPDAGEPPDVDLFLPPPDEVEDWVTENLGDTSLFAARFREAAARALLLPRRYPGKRSPLWAQRKKSHELLGVASQYSTFPILLETYRECLRDVFDLPGLVEILRAVASRKIRVTTVDSRTPSPFASSLLFSYVASFIYDGDAPLAERRAQALSVDQAQLKELLGEAELRELLDQDAIDATERSLQRLEERQGIRHADALHDLLLSLGDLTRTELEIRTDREEKAQLSGWLDSLQKERRIIEISLGGEPRFAAGEDAGKLRDAFGVVTPLGLPRVFLEPHEDALRELVSRYARTHGPFSVEALAARFAIGISPARAALERLAALDRVLEGEFLPKGRGREWCDAEVLRSLKRRSLAKLRKEVEPVDHAALARFSADWHNIQRRRRGLDALLSAIEQLQGAAIPASVLEREVFPARVEGYKTSDLDTLAAAGEIIWRGLEPLGQSDGRVAIYLTDQYRLLAPPAVETEGELPAKVRTLLAQRGALFWSDLSRETGGFPAELANILWAMVWSGEVTNDTFAPLRAITRKQAKKSGSNRRMEAGFRGRSFRSRRAGPPGTEGRWSLLPAERQGTETERAAALAATLLERHGVLTREAVAGENLPGGFTAVYSVLRAMEEAGRVRRGYFVAGLGATQFAVPGAEDRLRSVRERPEESSVLVLAATDPANPYGTALPWPQGQVAEGAAETTTVGRPQRAAGAQVILLDGALIAYAGRTERNLLTFLPPDEPERSEAARSIARALSTLVEDGRRRVVLIDRVDGVEPSKSVLGKYLSESGFTESSRGYFKRGVPKV
jgi:ATP-dependent Lhr-like helicase